MTIKELREEKGLNQGKFAESIGVSRTTIIGYEKGKFQPSTAVLAKINDVYGVNLLDSDAPAVEQPKKRSRKKKDDAHVVEETPAVAEASAPAAEEPAVEEPPVPKKLARKKKEDSAVPPANIKELRKGKGLSQAAFAQSIGVSTPSIGAYESGKFNPSGKVLDKIKEVYGVDFAPLVQEAPVKPKRARKKKEEATAEEKAAKKAPHSRKQKPVALFIQSPMGGSITPEEIAAKVGPVDTIYVRVDENKAYWVRGEESGSVDLW